MELFAISSRGYSPVMSEHFSAGRRGNHPEETKIIGRIHFGLRKESKGTREQNTLPRGRFTLT
jgi:hypothetical protein